MIFRHLAGEDLSVLGMKELKQMERQIKMGVERIRSQKVDELSCQCYRREIKRQYSLFDVAVAGDISANSTYL